MISLMGMRSRAKIFLFSLILFSQFLCGVLFGEANYTIRREIFIPKKFFVGDTVQLRLELKLNPEVRLKFPDKLPQSEWLRILDLQIAESRANNDVTIIKIFFVSYQPGTQIIPAIEIGDVTLNNLQIYTSSVLETEKDTKLKQMKKQLLFPGTYQLLLGFILTLVIVPVLVVFLFNKGRLFLKELKKRILRQRPMIQFNRSLFMLDKDMEKLEKKIFYLKLTTVLKRYLSLKTGKNIESLTTKETEYILSESKLKRDIVKDIVDFFRYSDRVKFQGYEPPVSDMKVHMDKMRKLIRDVEGFYA